MTLSAAASPVPAGTDIGFKSVSGNDTSSSTSGYAFSSGSDFSIAIDYAWSFSGSPTGFLGLGFGIGEDGGGENSAGALMVTSSGSPFLFFGGAARVDDVNEPALALGAAATLSGSLFVSLEASSGTVTVGASQTAGAASAAVSGTFDTIQTQWAGENLLASVFIRSVEGTSGWLGGGTADAVFSNFRILEGAAMAIPEPSASIFLLGLFGVIFGGVRRLR